MTSDDFKIWRSTMGWTQKQAADALGISESSVLNYEAGQRREDRRQVIIPKRVALACAALLAGLKPYGEDSAAPTATEPRPGARDLPVSNTVA